MLAYVQYYCLQIVNSQPESTHHLAYRLQED